MFFKRKINGIKRLLTSALLGKVKAISPYNLLNKTLFSNFYLLKIKLYYFKLFPSNMFQKIKNNVCYINITYKVAVRNTVIKYF